MIRNIIHVHSCSEYHEVLKVLFHQGYVFSVQRIKTIKEYQRIYGSDRWRKYLCLGFSDYCNAIIVDSNFPAPNAEYIEFKRFMFENASNHVECSVEWDENDLFQCA